MQIHAWKEWEKETQSVDYAFSSGMLLINFFLLAIIISWLNHPPKKRVYST